MISADGIRELMELGIVGDQMIAVVTLFEREASRLASRDGDVMARDVLADERKKSADRSRNYRLRRKQASRLASRDDRDAVSNIKEEKKTSEKEGKGKKKLRTKPRASLLPEDFQPKPSHFEAARRFGCDDQFALDKFEDMRIWATSNGISKVDWDQTLHGFIRRDAKQGSQNGNGINGYRANRAPGPAKAGNDAVLAGMGRLAGRIHERRVSAGFGGEVPPRDDAPGLLDLEPIRKTGS